MNQSDFLPESAPVYPYILIENASDNTAGVLNCLPEGEDIPVCIRHFDDIICLKTMELKFTSISFLLGREQIRIVTAQGSSEIQTDLVEFLKIYNKSKESS